MHSKLPQIVLVHGFRWLSRDREELSLKTVEMALHRRGFATHKFVYESKDDTVQGHALALAEFMLGLIASRQQPLGLVSHSFGGPLIRAALNTPLWNRGRSIHAGSLGEELRLAMLAPPNQVQ